MTNQISDLFPNQVSDISILTFILNLILSAILSQILSQVYKKYGRSLSNRVQFGDNFFILTMTTMLIITVVKSSLALSLGLVGALSIIRFRTAVKEPEELNYLFIAISIGLGLGANQTFITILALSIIIISIIFHNKLSKEKTDILNKIFTISSTKKFGLKIEDINKILMQHCTLVNIRRYDVISDIIEASFIININNYSSLQEIINEIESLEENIDYSFIDNKGLFN
jgi:hypothetical protein